MVIALIDFPNQQNQIGQDWTIHSQVDLMIL